MLHHAHTNSEDDPDIWVKGTFAQLVAKWFVVQVVMTLIPVIIVKFVAPEQYRKFAGQLRGSEVFQASAVATLVLLLLAVSVYYGRVWDWVFLLFVPARLAALALGIFFSWLPHYPFDRTERYLNTANQPLADGHAAHAAAEPAPDASPLAQRAVLQLRDGSIGACTRSLSPRARASRASGPDAAQALHWPHKHETERQSPWEKTVPRCRARAAAANLFAWWLPPSSTVSLSGGVALSAERDGAVDKFAMNNIVDVAIVGAGLAGLTAARDLRIAGSNSFVVLEASDRVGGRTLNHDLGHGYVSEAGGQWIGPGQTAVADLARELGVDTFPTYYQGETVMLAGDGRVAVDLHGGFGADPKMTDKLNALARLVPSGAPWKSPRAAELDAMSLGDWLRGQNIAPVDRVGWDLASLLSGGTTPAKLGFLHYLSMINSAGSDYDRLEFDQGQRARLPICRRLSEFSA